MTSKGTLRFLLACIVEGMLSIFFVV